MKEKVINRIEEKKNIIISSERGIENLIFLGNLVLRQVEEKKS
jgi:hypothetical protein